MSFTLDFSAPYLDELPLTTPNAVNFPVDCQVTIGGRPYVVDLSFEPYRRQSTRSTSMDPTRQAIDYTNIPGEGTVSTDLPWRRTADDWSLGSGQIFADRKKSADNRYYRSKGINPWMQWQATLLPDTTNVFGTDLEVKAIAAANYVYILTDTRVIFTSDYVHFITLEGLPVDGLADICTDGNSVYIAAQDNGVYTAVIGNLGATQYVTSGPVNTIAFVADRLMAAQGPNIYNIVATGALPAALFTHPTPSWVWNTFCFGSSQIYIGGSPTNGQAGAIYRTTSEPDGTALTVPVLSLPLENGERPHALHSYLNFVFVGTDLGLRMCETLAAYDPTGNEGDLRSGPLIPNITEPLTYPCTGITGNNRWVWFAWSYYDSVNSGIGRADISNFIDTLAPAYASDLMVPRGPIRYLDWCPITNGPLISVTGTGVFTQATTVVEQGTIQTGAITYGIPDDKICEFYSVRTESPQAGDVLVSIGVDGQMPQIVGGQYQGQEVSESQFPLGQMRGEEIDVTITLRANPARTAGPTLRRATLKAIAAIVAPTEISVVIINSPEVVSATGATLFFDVYAEKAFMENLRLTQQVVTYQEGLEFNAQVVVTGSDWLPNKTRDVQEGGYSGYLITYLKTIEAT